MKKILYSLLLIAGAGFAFAACSNGDYNANPSSNANNSVNPLSPLDSAGFNWINTGTAPMSATINGSPWTAGDSTGGGWVLDTGTNIISGIGSGKALVLYLKNVYGGSIYSMGYQNLNTFAAWYDNDTAISPAFSYFSYLGNSGQVQMLENDNVRVKGLFYFQGVNSLGAVLNITNGYFNITKP